MHRRAHPLLAVAILFVTCFATATLAFAVTPHNSGGTYHTGGDPEGPIVSHTGGYPERSGSSIPEDPHRWDPNFGNDLMNEGYGNDFGGGGGGGGGESIQEIQPSHNEPAQSQPSGDSGAGGGACGGPCGPM